jgi:hypothetical protein
VLRREEIQVRPVVTATEFRIVAAARVLVPKDGDPVVFVEAISCRQEWIDDGEKSGA